MIFQYIAYLIVIELSGPVLRDGRYDLGEADCSRSQPLLQLKPLGLEEATGHSSTCRRSGNGLEHLHHLFGGQHCNV